MSAFRIAANLVAASIIAGCSSNSSNSAANLPAGYYVSITNMSYSPLNLDAPAGATVTAINDDNVQHSLTSESAPEMYTPGSVAGVSFDTGAFTGMASLRLPAGVPEGTVIPYYCSVHKSAMKTRTGTITIRASAQPQPAPGSASGGGTSRPPGGGYGY